MIDLGGAIENMEEWFKFKEMGMPHPFDYH